MFKVAYKGQESVDFDEVKGLDFKATARIYCEHNTFTPTKYRGKGYLTRLYQILLGDGFVVCSDRWNHSEPMRKVWIKLANTTGVTMLAAAATDMVVDPSKPFKDKQWDAVLLAYQSDDAAYSRAIIADAVSELNQGYGWSLDDVHRPGVGRW